MTSATTQSIDTQTSLIDTAQPFDTNQKINLQIDGVECVYVEESSVNTGSAVYFEFKTVEKLKAFETLLSPFVSELSKLPRSNLVPIGVNPNFCKGYFSENPFTNSERIIRIFQTCAHSGPWMKVPKIHISEKNLYSRPF